MYSREKSYQTASLRIRLVSLVYESLLIFAITVFVLMVLGFIEERLFKYYPMYFKQMIFNLTILLSWGCYFILNWSKKGQTVAMKTWNIYLVDDNYQIPNFKKLVLRFIWSIIFVVFVPLLIYFIFRSNGYPKKISFVLAIIWWIFPWGWAVFSPNKQFIYDNLAGTQLVKFK